MENIKEIQKPGSLQAWLDHLQSLNPDHIELGLKRIRTVFDRLKLDSLNDLPITTIAGTNGKGSTAALISQALIKSGISCGLYTSPHLHRFNERVMINGREVDDELLCQAFSLIFDASNKEPSVALTYFEYTTLAAFICFKKANVEALVLEIGLGGRLDAVNLLDADVSVITSIGLDHMQILGNTIEEIASEKAGIIKPDSFVVAGAMDESALDVIRERAQAMHATIFEHGRDFNARFDSDCSYSERNIEQDLVVNFAIPSPRVPRECVAVALKALSLLKSSGLDRISYSAIVSSVSDTVLPGRMQKVCAFPDIYLDVAHNLPAAEHLKKMVEELHVTGHRYAVIGMLRDKDIEGVLAVLASVFDKFYVTSLHTSRGEENVRLQNALIKADVDKSLIKSFDNTSDALLQCCHDAGADDAIYVCGSFVTVAEADDCMDECIKFLRERN